jgi:hypothetical protein
MVAAMFPLVQPVAAAVSIASGDGNSGWRSHGQHQSRPYPNLNCLKIHQISI